MLLGVAALAAPAARADWVTFVDQTSTRLQAEPGLGSADPAEKDYAWGDVDLDGDVDLVCVRKEPFTTAGKRENVLFLNEGGVLVDRTAIYAVDSDVPLDQGFKTPTNDRDVQLVDLDLDGWLDIVTAVTVSDGAPKAVGHPRIYHNKGKDASGAWLGFRYESNRIPLMLPTSGQPGFNPRFASVAVGDLTGDGYPDLWFGDYDGSPASGVPEPPGADFDDRLLVNQGAANPGYFIDQTTMRFSGSVSGIDQPFPVSDFGASGVIGDMDGDGLADIVKLTLYAPLYVGVAYNGGPGQGFFDAYDVVYQGTPYFVSKGDLNNDGRLDLVITDGGTDRYLLNQGNAAGGLPDFVSFVFQFAHEGSGSASSDDSFGGNSWIADLNHDGWSDVLIADVDVDIPGCSRRLHIYRNLGGTPGGDVVLQEQTSGSGCATFNGNPASCIVAGIPSNQLEGVFDIAVFDLNGDASNDLVVGRCSGTQVYVNQPPAPAGSVPDGDGTPGTQLRMTKGTDGKLTLTWGHSCAAGDTNYEIYEGILGDFTSHVPWTCTTGGAPGRTITPGAGDRYYLIVPRSAVVEGSYGVDSQGHPRPQSTAPCLPMLAGACE